MFIPGVVSKRLHHHHRGHYRQRISLSDGAASHLHSSFTLWGTFFLFSCKTSPQIEIISQTRIKLLKQHLNNRTGSLIPQGIHSCQQETQPARRRYSPIRRGITLLIVAGVVPRLKSSDAPERTSGANIRSIPKIILRIGSRKAAWGRQLTDSYRDKTTNNNNNNERR